VPPQKERIFAEITIQTERKRIAFICNLLRLGTRVLSAVCLLTHLQRLISASMTRQFTHHQHAMISHNLPPEYARRKGLSSRAGIDR
jgi:hypothetical protein